MELLKAIGFAAAAAPSAERRWVFPLVASFLICVFLLTSFSMGLMTSLHSVNSFLSVYPSTSDPDQTAAVLVPTNLASLSEDDLPRLAYLVSGSKGDLDRLWRTLRALYHPRNQYVIHLDLESPASEREELARRVEEDPVFVTVGNVEMITKANMVTYTGPTMIANSLHACAILLKRRKKWDWFINLSAADYPLVTQDDIIHVFSSVPRNLNFVDHTSRLGWKEAKRAKPMIVDPGLYMSRKSSVFWVSQKRDLPTAFKLFTGSAWMALSREFVDFCVVGWDNLPRMLLMYYTNFVSSPEGYFHTVICNAPEFAKTVVNNDLHYIAWDTPPKQHPRNLTAGDIPLMVAGGAAFARKFGRVDANLDWIDSELLGRTNGSFVPGGWCAGSPPCSEVGNVTQLNPGPGAGRLDALMGRIVRSQWFSQHQCK
ncbi:unnamed protein product [Spirodela intermedia]|uniref:Uncharacterized protein n=1 Tax=Spirodela intermedia TaxID=51605 RepID=A0A7I8LFI7_SPIIN|nr:unnamed protein product [Spirodela intermedia]